MNLRRIAYIALAAAAMAMTAGSCKKEKDPEYRYLDGDLRITGAERLISPGDYVEFGVTGLTGIEGLTVSYRWNVTDKDKADTSKREDGGWGYRFPEKVLKTYTVTCYTSCQGYQSSAASVYVTTVAPGPDGTIPEIYKNSGVGKIKDREGHEYIVTRVGDLLWTTRNMACSSIGDDGETVGSSYYGYELMDDIVGRYYTYDEALKVCPEGWRLPSDADWMNAASTVAGNLAEHADWPGVSGAFMTYASFNEQKLWEFWPEVDVTGSTGIMALPLGFQTVESNSFSGFYNQAVFWTSDEIDEEKAYVRYIVARQPDMFCMAAYKSSFGASVRCVRDAE